MSGGGDDGRNVLVTLAPVHKHQGHGHAQERGGGGGVASEADDKVHPFFVRFLFGSFISRFFIYIFFCVFGALSVENIHFIIAAVAVPWQSWKDVVGEAQTNDRGGGGGGAEFTYLYFSGGGTVVVLTSISSPALCDTSGAAACGSPFSSPSC